MSNPTTFVETFDGSLGPFSGSGGPEFDNGLWLKSASANLLPNPGAEVNLIGWATWGSGVTLSRETAAPITGAGSAKATHAGNGSSGLSNSISGLSDAKKEYTYELDVLAPAGLLMCSAIWAFYTDATSAGLGYTYFTGDGSTHRVLGSGIPNASKTVSSLYVLAILDTAQAAGSFLVDNVSLIRAASSASISPAGILAPGSGALAFRITPTIETGVEEIWGECGVKGSGTDHLRWGRDSTKHPFCEWSANNAAYQRLTASETVDAGTAYDLYLGHDGTDVSLSVDAGTANTGTRAAVSDSFGAGDLTLKATAGGVIYDEFATFDRTLTNYEVARLNAAPAWSLVTLAANTQTRRIRQQFQLRPY